MALRALLIGANTLGLRYAERDVERFRDILELHGYDVFAAAANKSDIHGKLDEIVDETAKSDTLIIYFSGHALFERGGLHLILKDDIQSRSSKIDVKALIDALHDCSADQKLLILDCCHANASTADWSTAISDRYFLLTASERMERAKELDELQSSFLTNALIDILNSAEGCAQDGKILLHHVYNHIKKAAIDYNQRNPLTAVPIPSLLGNSRHTVTLALVSGDEAIPAHARLEREYRRLLLETCDILDLANMPQEERHLAARRLALRRLYVPLRMKIEVTADQTDHEKSFKLLEQHRLQKMRNTANSDSEKLESVGACLDRARRLVVLGDPGAGKSTLLRWITTGYLLRLANNPDWNELPDVGSLPDADLLPILIRCRDLPERCVLGNLRDMLRHTLRLHELGEHQVEKVIDGLEARLKAGTALLLIDGLDEIGTVKNRNAFCRQIERITTTYTNAMILVTSRIVGYREMASRIGHGFEHVTIADLSSSDKDDFARRWCDITELPERKEKATADLISQIHGHDRIERLTGNPMLLTTMALVKRKIGRLPQRRIELYSEAVKVLLNWRSEIDDPLDSHEAEPQLQYIAYSMCERGVQQLREDEILSLLEQVRRDYPNLHALGQHTPREFLRLLERRTGLIFESGTIRHKGRFVPVFEFRHLTFQEYLAGMALVEGRYPNLDPSKPLAYKVGELASITEKKDTKRTVVSERWREALRLCIAAWQDNDIDTVLDFILNLSNNENTDEYHARILLACDCLSDDINVSEDTARKIIKALTNVINDTMIEEDETFEDNEFTKIGKSRWKNIAQNIFLDSFMDNMYITHAIFLGSLDTFQENDEFSEWINKKMDMLRSESYASIIACLEIGVAASSRYSHDLADIAVDLIYLDDFFRLTDGNDHELFASLLCLCQMIDSKWIHEYDLNEDFIEKLKHLIITKESNKWVVFMSIYTLKEIDHLNLTDTIVTRINDDHKMVREIVVEYLGNFREKKYTRELIERCSDKEKDVKYNAIEALGKIHSTESIDTLISLLYDSDKKTISKAIDSLGNIADSRAINPLISLLFDPDKNIQRQAISALSKIDDEKCFEIILSSLENKDDSIRNQAIYSLSTLKDERIIEPLINLLSNNSDESAKYRIVSALGRYNNTLVIQALISLLEDSSAMIRSAAARNLGRIGSNQAVHPLIRCLDDKDDFVYWNIISSLTNIGGSEITDILFSKLSSDDARVYSASAIVLGRLNDPRSIELLLRIADDTDNRMRVEAIKVLCLFKNEYGIDLLLKELENKNLDFQIEAAEILSNIQDQRGKNHLYMLLSHETTINRQTALGALGKTLSEMDRKLISRDLDAEYPWIDPQRSIRERRVSIAAQKLGIEISEVRTHYEQLAAEFGLKLEWRTTE